MSIMLTDQGARPPLDFSLLLSQMTYLFRMLDFPQNLTLFKPGPLSINGAPSLSDRSRCNLTATRMSVYSFQNENDGPQQNAKRAAQCTQGVLLPAAIGAPARCACKFLVPHFSSFGVSMQIMLVKFFQVMFQVLTKASNVSFQVVDDAPDTQSPPTPAPAPPTTNRPLPSSDASPGTIAGSVVGAIACKPWQPQPCTKFSRI